MIHDPKKIDHLRPKRSFTYGTRGSARIAPKLYDAEMMPRSAPFGLLKSTVISYDGFILMWECRTKLPLWRYLNCVDHLRVEARGYLDADACR